MNVQAVLAGTGIPTFASAWVPAADGDMPPAQYIVHNYARAPDHSAADEVQEYATYGYVNLYSTTNPATAVAAIRTAAKAAGWGVIDERSDYDNATNHYAVYWTFVGWDNG